MVEIVARALGRHADSVGMEPNPEHWAHFARAAIEAMREPDGEMLNAGLSAGLSGKSIYRAMLDAALALPIPGGENTEGEKP